MTSARDALGRSLEWLAEHSRVPTSELQAIELGLREVGPGELARIAKALEMGVDWFVTESPPAVRSLRSGRDEGPHVARIDLVLERLARDIELLRSLGVLSFGTDEVRLPMPTSPDAAEDAARTLRSCLDLAPGPLLDLHHVIERLGVHTFCLTMPANNPDGAYVSLERGGVVVVNGEQDAGRRRFTLAHELGHHVFQDEYATDWVSAGSRDTERLINAFAVHLLLPRESIIPRWRQLTAAHDPRRAALVLGVEYRVSWSVICAQCDRLGLLDASQRDSLVVRPPERSDFQALGLHVEAELVPPSLSPGLTHAILSAFRRNLISAGRAVEMLRDTASSSRLPRSEDIPLQAYRGDFGAP